MGKFELDGFNYVRVRIKRYLRIHTGCDAISSSVTLPASWFQSTHPHGVRPLLRTLPTETLVSIHAPTRGATFNPVDSYNKWAVSIHAPTRGATALWYSVYIGVSVSIHAPTRGATLAWSTDIDFLYAFQSTHPHGVRLSLVRF